MFTPHKKLLMITDIDDSIYWEHSTKLAVEKLHQHCTKIYDIVYVTGRTSPEVNDLINSGRLPNARLVFSDLGTVLYDFRCERANPLIRSPFTHDLRSKIKSISDRCDALKLQTISANRLSFFVQGHKSEVFKSAEKIRQLGVDVYVTSRYLDVLPENINKGSCAEYLLSFFKKSYLHITLIGDSENDFHLLVNSSSTPASRFLVAESGIYHQGDKDVPLQKVVGPISLLKALKRSSAYALTI